MIDVSELLHRTYLRNPLSQWFVALAIALVIFFVALFVRRTVRRQYERYAATDELEVMELPFKIASRTTALFLLIVSVFAGLQALDMPKKLDRVLTSALTIAIAWQVGVWATTAMITWLARRERQTLARDRAVAG